MNIKKWMRQIALFMASLIFVTVAATISRADAIDFERCTYGADTIADYSPLLSDANPLLSRAELQEVDRLFDFCGTATTADPFSAAIADEDTFFTIAPPEMAFGTSFGLLQ